MKKIEKPKWENEWTSDASAWRVRSLLRQLIDNQNEIITDLEPDPTPKEGGYYWCETCAQEIAYDSTWACDDLRFHNCGEQGHAKFKRQVTGPHLDKCPECNAPMAPQYYGGGFWRMECKSAQYDHFAGPKKEGKAEAIHAWRKVMRT